MPTNKQAMRRYLAIADAIKGGKSPSMRDLIAAVKTSTGYDTSVSTVQKDIQNIKRNGFMGTRVDIGYSRWKRGYYLTGLPDLTEKIDKSEADSLNDQVAKLEQEVSRLKDALRQSHKQIKLVHQKKRRVLQSVGRVHEQVHSENDTRVNALQSKLDQLTKSSSAWVIEVQSGGKCVLRDKNRSIRYVSTRVGKDAAAQCYEAAVKIERR